MPPRASTSNISDNISTSKVSKIALPAFLKLLTSGGVGLTTQEALAAASSLIKVGLNTSDTNPFTGTSDVTLVAAGVTDPDVRKAIVAYGRTGKGKTLISDSGGIKRKRKTRESDLDAPLPMKAEEREAIKLEFNEELEDYLLQDRSLVINRAPCMTAWATVVAQRLGFARQEALSMAHTYTNMNATAKGVSLGIYSPEKGKQRTEVGPSQPYVDLMGRKIPVLSLQTGEWRGIANGAIAEPEQAFGYIARSFRQHLSAAMGAFKLLADTFEPEDLNKAGYQLYTEFRPEVRGWGEKGKLELAKVLELRKRPLDTKVIKREGGTQVEDVFAGLSQEEHKPSSDDLLETQIDTSYPNQVKTITSEEKILKLEADEDLPEDNGGVSDSDIIGLL